MEKKSFYDKSLKGCGSKKSFIRDVNYVDQEQSVQVPHEQRNIII